MTMRACVFLPTLFLDPVVIRAVWVGIPEFGVSSSAASQPDPTLRRTVG